MASGAEIKAGVRSSQKARSRLVAPALFATAQAKIIRVVNAQKQIRHVMRNDALGRGATLLEDVVHIQTAGQRREQAVVRVQLREVFNPDVHRHTSSCSTWLNEVCISSHPFPTLRAVAGSDRTVEPVQPVGGDPGLANMWPPPRSTPRVHRE